MAWAKSTPNKNNMLTVAKETITLPSSATVGYSSEINFLEVDPVHSTQTITICAVASAVTGTNLDIALYGAYEKGGTKFLLLDAVVTDVDNSNKVQVKTVDLNLYPAPFYYLGHTADADEHANTITYYVMY